MLAPPLLEAGAAVASAFVVEDALPVTPWSSVRLAVFDTEPAVPIETTRVTVGDGWPASSVPRLQSTFVPELEQEP